MHIEMVVAGLTIDPVNNAPIVILREKEGTRIVPIWIGAVEASAIAFELEEVKLPRPMTHDLLKGTIESLGGQVERVTIVDLREGTYYAVIVLSRDGETIELDARPSDGIALALRAGAPVLCDARVVDEAHVSQDSPREEEQSMPAAKSAKKAAASKTSEEPGEGGPRPIVDSGDMSPEELLESLKPEDFGKYKM